MSRRTRLLLLVTGVASLLFVVFVWMRSSLGQPKSILFQLLLPVRTEMRPFLLALRNGDRYATGAALARVREHSREGAFEDWLRTVLNEGRTTEDEAIALLGKHFTNHDLRPAYGLIALQYELGGFPGDYLVLYFDADTHVLNQWEISHAICGFCPHVFAFDGRWRLEGKLLAGCVGVRNEGADTLPLPRLAAQGGELRLKVSNLAPETEYLDHVQLGGVLLQEGEELDIDPAGRPIAWTSLGERVGSRQPAGEDVDEVSLDLGKSEEARALIVEVRNTSAFETAMQEALSRQVELTGATLQVQISEAAAQAVRPVGTKFLRRIVLRVPPGSGCVRLRSSRNWWLLRRLFVGRFRVVEESVVWQPPSAVQGPIADARRLLLAVDQQRVCLEQSQEVELVFPAPETPAPGTRWGYVVRMSGYYDFLPAALGGMAPK
jgi:hypothetical protein